MHFCCSSLDANHNEELGVGGVFAGCLLDANHNEELDEISAGWAGLGWAELGWAGLAGLG